MPRFRRTDTPSPALVRVAGELDITSAHEVDERLRLAEEQSEDGVTVDLSGVTFVDARGLDVLCLAAGRCHAFRITGAPPQLTRIIEALGAESLPELSAALEHASAPELALVA